MSVQFGRWNLDGRPVDSHYMEKVGSALSPYGPDSKGSYNSANLSIQYYAFHTTKESHGEVQPHVCASGNIITWDGRLDNRSELIGEFDDELSLNSTDVRIVAAAYEKYGTKCFAKLLGDWALSIWNSVTRSLVLAKDPIGTRHLHYTFDDDQVTWSTILDPLVRLPGKTFALDEEYVAGWLSTFPAAHLTPYVGIHSVPPSSFVLLGRGTSAVTKYWDFDPKGKTRYRTDAEYEEQFRAVFSTAVQRTLRSDRPVLAELSGGRDSSAIVCVADEIIARGGADTPRLDTVSYFDDDEPNWNERVYFAKVEEKRGRVGWHINIGAKHPEHSGVTQLSSQSPCTHFRATPGAHGHCSLQLRACLVSQSCRVVLSGIGGDEVTGGVPTALPELQDLLATAQLFPLLHQLKAWAMEKRKPWFHLLWEAIRGFMPPALVGVQKDLRPVPWLQARFTKHYWAALTGYPTRTTPFGPMPSFQEHMATVDALRRQMACTALPFEPPYEKRYPYLDRSLLELMFAIPREQLVRPTQRRSLMRRALVGFVPDEILNRKTKAFAARSPMVSIANDWTHITEITRDMLSGLLEIVDPERLVANLQKVRRGEVVPIVSLLRTLQIEDWLRTLRAQGTIGLDIRRRRQVDALSLNTSMNKG